MTLFDGDLIELRGIRVHAHHGVYAHERERGQQFIIDATLAVDLRPSATTDELRHTVNYAEVVEQIVAAVRGDVVDLIETVAARVAKVTLQFDDVRAARITVHKPEAPIETPFDDVAVTIVRTRADFEGADR